MSRPSSTPSLDPTGEIPDRLYFKIGEAALLVGVQSHVLRYWEKEIPGVRPLKSPTNQRRYRRRDVEIFREVRRLLHEERYTLAGVRKRLADEKNRQKPNAADGDLAPDGAGDDQTNLGGEPPVIRPKDSIASNQVEPTSRELHPTDDATLQRLRDGLRELVRLAGEEP